MEIFEKIASCSSWDKPVCVDEGTSLVDADVETDVGSDDDDIELVSSIDEIDGITSPSQASKRVEKTSVKTDNESRRITQGHPMFADQVGREYHTDEEMDDVLMNRRKIENAFYEV